MKYTTMGNYSKYPKLEKSKVKAHQRRTKTGKIVQVREHEDSRQSKKQTPAEQAHERLKKLQPGMNRILNDIENMMSKINEAGGDAVSPGARDAFIKALKEGMGGQRGAFVAGAGKRKLEWYFGEKENERHFIKLRKKELYDK